MEDKNEQIKKGTVFCPDARNDYDSVFRVWHLGIC